MIDLRPVAYVIGRILIVLAILMAAPAIVDLRAGEANGYAFAHAAMITGFAGVTVALATGNALGAALDVRQAYLLTAAIWIIVPAFAALPFVWGAPRLDPLHAYFEAMSGLTTTGASLITGLDALPMGTNLWRGMTNWLGGLGIAFIAMIFLPLMRVGGMQFFRTENFDTFGKAMPRAADLARQLLLVYLGLTILCITTYSILGMPILAAVVHGFGTIGTGGVSPYDSSFNKFQGAGEYFGALFMFLSTLPYVRYVQMLNGQSRPFWEDVQIRAYLRWLLGAVLIVTLWRVITSEMPIEEAFRQSLFNLTSIMSSTGYYSGSFPEWGGLMLIVAFVLGMIGACSGSTGSGLTVFRVQLALEMLKREVRRITLPSAVDPVKYQGRSVGDDVINTLILFISSYIVLLGVLTVAMTLMGVDLVSALFGIWAGLSNVGYGFGPLVEAGGGTFAKFPDGAIVLIILAMILGRLGLLAILVLLLPAFWRR